MMFMYHLYSSILFGQWGFGKRMTEVCTQCITNMILLYLLYHCKCNLIKKQPSCKKGCGLQKSQGEKRCEIKGGGQEMAVMVG